MSPSRSGDGRPSRLQRVRHFMGTWKPRLVKGFLAGVAALGIAAEIIQPLGDALKGRELVGGSFAALIALILFDAISDSEPQEVSGVYVLANLNDLQTPFWEAFEARHVRIDFSGFTMQTLIGLLREPLQRLADEEVRTQELTLRIIVAHLNLPMSLPGRLDPAPENSEHPSGTVFFADSMENRRRMRDAFTKPNWNELKELLDSVHERNPHITISCEVRESPQVPERKFYILNQEKLFYAPYGIVEAEVSWQDNDYRILDTAGFGLRYGQARIIGWDRRSKSRSTQEIAEHHMEWHRNLWEKLKYIKPENPVIADPRWVPPEERPGR
ncbi:hypothetical protein I2W78_21145 [Streptomyces spinoverrucosus]|uniref:hypothetical protein n=1 Tax=Streptomyces spinoverrucosus TaxID=284043 RepID=UPI0018C37DC0|nr:hypothetical protein [Streptomyces spinoverrucosus]MBG0854273.1 hypothetical protein [Streptomyces spinoverrucosus]